MDPNDINNISAAQVRSVAEAAAREDKFLKDVAARKETADLFVAAHPEFIDVEHNAKLMSATLKAAYGDVRFTLEQYEAVFDHLSDEGLFRLNQTEVAKRRAAENKQRYAAEQKVIAQANARKFNPNVDYDNLSLEEIRARANEQVQQDMQRRGEEGGW